MTPLPPEREALPYRPGVGVIVVGDDGRVLVGRRIRSVGQERWQFPQGGVHSGEPALEAALRELHEEIGARDVEVVAALDRPLRIRHGPEDRRLLAWHHLDYYHCSTGVTSAV